MKGLQSEPVVDDGAILCSEKGWRRAHMSPHQHVIGWVEEGQVQNQVLFGSLKFKVPGDAG